MTAKNRGDAALADEIAALVWYAIVRDGAQLLRRFNPDFGCRLSTFLMVVARREVQKHFRSEKRRKRRESAAAQPSLRVDDRLLVDINEFAASLSLQEQKCLREAISSHRLPSAADRTATAVYKARSRLRLKLRKHLE